MRLFGKIAFPNFCSGLSYAVEKRPSILIVIHLLKMLSEQVNVLKYIHLRKKHSCDRLKQFILLILQEALCKLHYFKYICISI